MYNSRLETEKMLEMKREGEIFTVGFVFLEVRISKESILFVTHRKEPIYI